MSASVRFDVYARTRGRWQRLKTFPEEERETAQRLAENADAEPEVDGVRMMEVRDYGGGRSPVEVLAWISPHLAKSLKRRPKSMRKPSAPSAAAVEPDRDAARARAAALPDRDPDAPGGASSPAADVPSEEKRPRKSAIAGRFVLTLILAAGLALAAMIPARMAATELVSSRVLSPDAAPTVTLGAVGFLFVVAVLAFLPAIAGRGALRALTAPAEARPVTPSVTPPPSPPEDEDETEDVAADAEDAEEDDDAEVDGEAPAPATPPPDAAGLAEDCRVAMMRFLESTLIAVKDDVPRMDQLTNFGLCLFLAGAGDRFGQSRSLTGMQTLVIIREAIEAVGTPAARVERFAENLADYREDDTYRTMIAAGGDTMGRHLDGDEGAFQAVSETLRRWTRSPAAVAQLSGILTVMFTDLVGSTSMTSQMGDHGAQRIVRAHNAIVRSALAQHHGEEVKHTGDGIMASFANAAQAVRAAIRIQSDVTKQREGKGGLPLHIRIGLNAGDAVKEEDDLFGSAVQLAARVCDKAEADQVFVTNSVVDLSATQGFGFESRGAMAMKGIDEPVPVYEVMWRAAP